MSLHKDIRNRNGILSFEYADINALLLKQFLVAKEVRFYAYEKS